MVKVICSGRSEPQNWAIRTCVKISQTEILADCWYCHSGVEGFILPDIDKPGRYVMRCENCGRVEYAYYDENEYHKTWPGEGFYWQYIEGIGRDNWREKKGHHWEEKKGHH